MKKIKGHFRRKISELGYHIHPRFDLAEFRRRQHRKKIKKSEPALPLTALIDIFSMLVIFLLMNFSTSGDIFYMSKEKIQIPVATQTKPLETHPLISITSQTLMFDYPGLSPLYLQNPLESETLEKLREKLQELKALKKPETDNPDTATPDPAATVNLQADQKTPAAAVKRVMSVLITEGLGDINFAVTHVEAN